MCRNVTFIWFFWPDVSTSYIYIVLYRNVFYNKKNKKERKGQWWVKVSIYRNAETSSSHNTQTVPNALKITIFFLPFKPAYVNTAFNFLHFWLLIFSILIMNLF